MFWGQDICLLTASSEKWFSPIKVLYQWRVSTLFVALFVRHGQRMPWRWWPTSSWRKLTWMTTCVLHVSSCANTSMSQFACCHRGQWTGCLPAGIVPSIVAVTTVTFPQCLFDLLAHQIFRLPTSPHFISPAELVLRKYPQKTSLSLPSYQSSRTGLTEVKKN